MADSPAEAILDACVTLAKTLDFTGSGSAPDIPDEHVLAVTVPYTRDHRQRFTITPRPALVFSMARSTDTPAPGGDTTRYVTFYTVLAQILWTELDYHWSDVSKSILKWEYAVRNYFHMGNLRQTADSDNWKITLSPVQRVDVRDEKLFHMFDDAVSVTPIMFKSTEQHSTAGRT